MAAPEVKAIDILRGLAEKERQPEPGDRGPEVAAVQEALTAGGYGVKPDGFFGPATREAIMRFQKDHRLAPTGTADYSTVGTLLEVLASAVPGGEEAPDPVQQAKTAAPPPEAETIEPPPESEPIKPPPESKGEEEPREAASVKPLAISDGAVADLSQDRLGFRGYVLGLVEFLSSTDTKPPLAIAITARWGQGKTSFMRMIDHQLRTTQHAGGIQFATAWFNPWLYSDPEQVWNAFVTTVTRCIQQALPRTERIKFEWRRFYRNLQSQRLVGFGLWIRISVLAAIAALFFASAFTQAGRDVSFAVIRDVVGNHTAAAISSAVAFPWLARLLGAFVLLYLLYFQIIRKLNLGLLEYLKQKDFKAKVGALAQFQHEMEQLADTVSEQLRVVVFIDDLDRCEREILMEVIGALQLLSVSSKITYIMGLDMAIVARQIEGTVPARALEQTDEEQHEFQHGSGFRFLEKIIQARLSVPHYGAEAMKAMVSDIMRVRTKPSITPRHVGEPPEHPVGEDRGEAIQRAPVGRRVVATTRRLLGLGEQPEEVVDSPQIVLAMERYGPKYFKNPRRLKRYLNSFRVHAYLANAAGGGISTDLLARYLVLAERWPGLVDYFLRQPDVLDQWLDNPRALDFTRERAKKVPKVLFDIGELMCDAEAEVGSLFRGEEGEEPLTGKTLERTSGWYGFRFYRAPEPDAASETS